MCQSLLLALANPYGFFARHLELVIHYLPTTANHAKLTDVAPVHRMAKAVAIVPVGMTSAVFRQQGRSTNGTKLFLLTFDLAFQFQERCRPLNPEAIRPTDFAVNRLSRARKYGAATRLLRQWAIPAGAAIQPAGRRADASSCRPDS